MDPPKKDTAPSMPAQPSTRQLPAMTTEAMIADIYRIAKNTDKTVEVIRADQDLLMGTVESLKVDVRDLQRWKIDTEDRQTKHSGGLTRASKDTMEVQAELAKERAAREALTEEVKANTKLTAEVKTALATNTDATLVIKDAVAGFWKRNPKLEYALVGLILAVLGVATTLITKAIQ